MDGRVQLKEAYISVRDGEAWLFNAHISPYSHGNRENHDPLRTRKLLLHKREISRLDEATAKQGMTLVPTQLYLKNGRIKIRSEEHTSELQSQFHLVCRLLLEKK